MSAIKMKAEFKPSTGKVHLTLIELNEDINVIVHGGVRLKSDSAEECGMFNGHVNPRPPEFYFTFYLPRVSKYKDRAADIENWNRADVKVAISEWIMIKKCIEECNRRSEAKLLER